MRVHILVSITSRFKLDLCLLDDYMISFKTHLDLCVTAARTPRHRVGNQLPASLTTGTFLVFK
ncbi:hypothetical protein CY34DRAFT_753095 [Suillus luteus UH-Slu-Lm8-n1]|uniref:Unplaced genomic scaffold CY34scaffold_98, whole genome shotgun sequence n=1 Tax=Suillus luteus UH-Slu-Lm8-n1 TaxID=930992 RepID=A0A0D0AYD7_9AGAM|nr:hypothetical protein CY34DRAFT_753095 [Suillus luteus UH-Slu-Lm8-n1]